MSRPDLLLQAGSQDALECYFDVASVVLSVILVLVLCVWAWQILAHEVGQHGCAKDIHRVQHLCSVDIFRPADWSKQRSVAS